MSADESAYTTVFPDTGNVFVFGNIMYSTPARCDPGCESPTERFRGDRQDRLLPKKYKLTQCQTEFSFCYIPYQDSHVCSVRTAHSPEELSRNAAAADIDDSAAAVHVLHRPICGVGLQA